MVPPAAPEAASPAAPTPPPSPTVESSAVAPEPQEVAPAPAPPEAEAPQEALQEALPPTPPAAAPPLRPAKPARPERPPRPTFERSERRPRPDRGPEERPSRAPRPPGGPPWARREREGRFERDRAPGRPVPAPRPRRSSPEQFTRLHINLGAEMGIGPGDVVGAIAGETGLPAQVVGTIDIRERHLFVDVATEHARAISSKLSRAQLRGQRMKVKTA